MPATTPPIAPARRVRRISDAAALLMMVLAGCGSVAEARDAAVDGAEASAPTAAADAPAAPPRVTDVAMGVSHVCALREDGVVRRYGANSAGELGDGTTTDRAAAVTVAGLPRAVQVVAGDRHTCARLVDGTVRCWGSNADGQLGDGVPGDVPAPVPAPVPGLVRVTQLASGARSACALLDDGAVRCWGEEFGPSPAPLAGVEGAVAIVVPFQGLQPGQHCALLRDGGLRCRPAGTEPALDGTLRCLGTNLSGQLGDGSTTHRFAEYVTPGVAGVAEVAVTGATQGKRIKIPVILRPALRAGSRGFGPQASGAGPGFDGHSACA